MLKRIFGEERYYSPELKREAYLYLTFDEKYYQDMKAVIDDVYNTWLKELEYYKTSRKRKIESYKGGYKK